MFNLYSNIWVSDNLHVHHLVSHPTTRLATYVITQRLKFVFKPASRQTAGVGPLRGGRAIIRCMLYLDYRNGRAAVHQRLGVV